MTDALTMHMSTGQLEQALTGVLSANDLHLPILIEGPPGIGKTRIPTQIAKKLDWHLFVMHPPLLESVDLRGVPVPDLEAQVTRWLPPAFLPGVGNMKHYTIPAPSFKPNAKGTQRKKYNILFLIDELRQAPTPVQNAFSQLVLDRRCGEYKLPDYVKLVATSNQMQHRAGTTKMPTHLSRRFAHIVVEHNLRDWATWAIENEILPDIIAAVHAYPDILMDFDPVNNGEVYACPGSWEYASEMLKKTTMSDSIKETLLAGIVGQAAASAFAAFRRILMSGVDPDEAIRNPDKVKLKGMEASTKFALCTAVAYRATADNVGQIAKFAARLEEEYAVIMLQFVGMSSEANSTTEFRDWYTKHTETLFGV